MLKGRPNRQGQIVCVRACVRECVRVCAPNFSPSCTKPQTKTLHPVTPFPKAQTLSLQSMNRIPALFSCVDVQAGPHGFSVVIHCGDKTRASLAAVEEKLIAW